jgi:transposase
MQRDREERRAAGATVVAPRSKSELTESERARLRELERENRELRRANEVLKAATAFFAQEADPTRPLR